MKVMKLTVVVACVALTTNVLPVRGQRCQQRLYLDDGTGLFSLLKSKTLGGTGQTVYFPNAGSSATSYALLPDNTSAGAWTANDLFYASGTTGVVSRLGIGTANQVLSMNGTGDGLVWTTLAASNSSTGLQTTPADVATITSTSLKMAGLAGYFTPNGTGKCLIILTGNATSSPLANNTTQTIALRFGTLTAPAWGAAVTGTALGSSEIIQPGAQAHAELAEFCIFGYVLLTPGTTYWLDAAASASSPNSTTLTSVAFTAVELP